jgi:hypothetical protein
MIKAIVYHKIEEKKILETELMAAVPKKKRVFASKVLMSIFSSSAKKYRCNFPGS